MMPLGGRAAICQEIEEDIVGEYLVVSTGAHKQVVFWLCDRLYKLHRVDIVFSGFQASKTPEPRRWVASVPRSACPRFLEKLLSRPLQVRRGLRQGHRQRRRRKTSRQQNTSNGSGFPGSALHELRAGNDSQQDEGRYNRDRNRARSDTNDALQEQGNAQDQQLKRDPALSVASDQQHDRAGSPAQTQCTKQRSKPDRRRQIDRGRVYRCKALKTDRWKWQRSHLYVIMRAPIDDIEPKGTRCS